MRIRAIVGFILLCLAAVGLWYCASLVGANLQTEMQENASLRRQVVELEERQKVYAEVFECAEIRGRLGL